MRGADESVPDSGGQLILTSGIEGRRSGRQKVQLKSSSSAAAKKKKKELAFVAPSCGFCGERLNTNRLNRIELN